MKELHSISRRLFNSFHNLKDADILPANCQQLALAITHHSNPSISKSSHNRCDLVRFLKFGTSGDSSNAFSTEYTFLWSSALQNKLPQILILDFDLTNVNVLCLDNENKAKVICTIREKVLMPCFIRIANNSFNSVV
jgi:hypothetical protein